MQLQQQGNYGQSKNYAAEQGASSGFASGMTSATGPALAMAPFTGGLSLLGIPAAGAIGAATGAITGASQASGEKFGILPRGQQDARDGSPFRSSFDDMLLRYYMEQLQNYGADGNLTGANESLAKIWDPQALTASGPAAMGASGMTPFYQGPAPQLPPGSSYGLFDINAFGF